jgi:hypothetical protein
MWACTSAHPGLLGKNTGCGRGRGQAEQLASVLGPGQGEGTHSGGLAGAGWAIASCSRAPEVHIWRTSEACPASSAVRFAPISSRARSTAVGSTDAPPRCPAAVRRRCSASRIRWDV